MKLELGAVFYSLAGQRMWARGYFVDMVGSNEEVIRRNIGNQESEDRSLDKLELPWEC